MLKRAVFACLMLAACTPDTGQLEEPAPEQASAPEATADRILPTVTKPAEPDSVVLAGLVAGARVTSPLTVEGVADNRFFFEGVFPVELVANGEVVAQAPAQQHGDRNWTTPGPVRFKAELTFEVTKDTSAELVLSEDMPRPLSDDSDERGPARAVRIPVVLAPPQ